eukprot:785325-Heterocapsa_arctica.AAC.1
MSSTLIPDLVLILHRQVAAWANGGTPLYRLQLLWPGTRFRPPGYSAKCRRHWGRIGPASLATS